MEQGAIRHEFRMPIGFALLQVPNPIPITEIEGKNRLILMNQGYGCFIVCDIPEPREEGKARVAPQVYQYAIAKKPYAPEKVYWEVRAAVRKIIRPRSLPTWLCRIAKPLGSLRIRAFWVPPCRSMCDQDIHRYHKTCLVNCGLKFIREGKNEMLRPVKVFWFVKTDGWGWRRRLCDKLVKYHMSSMETFA
jgi:hypothetical protein